MTDTVFRESTSIEREDLSDHDLLVRLDVRVGQLIKWTNGHDKAHARTRGGIIGAFVAILAVAVGVLLDRFLP